MSKYDEIGELARQAEVDIANYKRESAEFVETLAAEWGAYLEVGVNLVTVEEAYSDKPEKGVDSGREAITMGSDGYWYFGLAITLFPRQGQLTIPLLFRKVKDSFKLKIGEDAQNKTFLIKEANPETLAPFFDYLFSSIREYYQHGFKDFIDDESKRISGFNRKALTQPETDE